EAIADPEELLAGTPTEQIRGVVGETPTTAIKESSLHLHQLPHIPRHTLMPKLIPVHPGLPINLERLLPLRYQEPVHDPALHIVYHHRHRQRIGLGEDDPDLVSDGVWENNLPSLTGGHLLLDGGGRADCVD